MDGIVGETITFRGAVFVTLTKNDQKLDGYIVNPRDGSIYDFYIQVYKGGVVVDIIRVIPDGSGHFSATFIPKEPGYYMIDWTSGYDWIPLDPFYKALWKDTYFYVSEKKDSDGDGVPDQYDYDPYDPKVQTKSDIKMIGLGLMSIIANLLMVLYLIFRRNM
ncbi:MAG: hypothetical protein ACXQTS_00600 [Candidatus Methanospirareceae archaeon]